MSVTFRLDWVARDLKGRLGAFCHQDHKDVVVRLG